MTVFLSPVGGAAAQFFDNSGLVLTGGQLFTYLAGTTTPTATYTSSTAVAFHTNPIILDASGRVPNGGEIWLADGISYKFVLKDANNVLIGTYDNIFNFLGYSLQEQTFTATQSQTIFTLTTVIYTPGINTLNVYVNGSKQIAGTNYVETNSTTVTFSSGLNVGDIVEFTNAVALTLGTTDAALVAYIPAGAGAVTTTVQAKLRESISVLDFGADKTGATNSTTAFTNAWTAANPQAVFVPAGSYAITGTVTGKFYSLGTVTITSGTVTSITNLVP
ncbi:MAG: glycosyl hydrolase family 28-related protein [Chthoniobacterales bacterium]